LFSSWEREIANSYQSQFLEGSVERGFWRGYLCGGGDGWRWKGVGVRWGKAEVQNPLLLRLHQALRLGVELRRSWARPRSHRCLWLRRPRFSWELGEFQQQHDAIDECSVSRYVSHDESSSVEHSYAAMASILLPDESVDDTARSRWSGVSSYISESE
jgi:hypothetical protein